jgi:predicted dehydrogenase
VREVYTWCNRPRTGGRFAKHDGPPPAHLDWDLWLGPAKQRPYAPDIHPKDWRGFWEYGGGTFGDMASHVMDLPFWALGLRHPTSVEAEGPPVDPVSAPAGTLARYEFPALKFYWSDGGKHFDLVKNTMDHRGRSLSTWGLGILFVGAEANHCQFHRPLERMGQGMQDGIADDMQLRLRRTAHRERAARHRRLSFGPKGGLGFEEPEGEKWGARE